MNQTPFPGIESPVILEWLAHHGWSLDATSVLTGDVSPRRYVRLNAGGETAILALYPVEIRPACRRFLESTRLLVGAGVRIPRVLASDCKQGLMLLEDVGSDTLYDLRETVAHDLGTLFWQAATDIDRIQSIAVEELVALNPPLDGALLWQELRQTWNCLFEPRGLVAESEFSRALEKTLRSLCESLEEEVPVPCHRDFMSRNLVPVQPHPQLAILDHQDLRLGPPLYDLASLLNDSLFPTAAVEGEILAHFIGDSPTNRVRYHRAAAQRTLKAVGTYESFALRGFPRHRQLIPETLRRSLQHLAQLPEARAIVGRLEERVTSLIIC